MHKKALTMIIILATLYIAIAAFTYCAQRTMIYHGRPITKPVPANVEPITITTPDGIELTGWHIKSSSPAPKNKTIINFHGNVGNVEWRYDKMMQLADKGYDILLAGYRGYGNNDGKPSEQGLYTDARAHINWLRDTRGIPENDIILFGESLGSGVATQMATEYNAHALILEAPYTTLPNVAKTTYFWLPVDWLMKDKFANIDKIAGINMPLLILHGAKDKVIPIRQAEDLYNAAQQPKTFIPIADAKHITLFDNGAALHIDTFLRTIESTTKE